MQSPPRTGEGLVKKGGGISRRLIAASGSSYSGMALKGADNTSHAQVLIEALIVGVALRPHFSGPSFAEDWSSAEAIF